MDLSLQVSKPTGQKFKVLFLLVTGEASIIAELVAHQPTEPKVEGLNLAQENSFRVGSWQFDDRLFSIECGWFWRFNQWSK